MKNLFYFIALLLMSTFAACQENEVEYGNQKSLNQNNPNIREIYNKLYINTFNTRSEQNQFPYLGRGYDITLSNYMDPESSKSLTLPIIDVNGLFEMDKNYVDIKPINEASSSFSSFSHFSEYLSTFTYNKLDTFKSTVKVSLLKKILGSAGANYNRTAKKQFNTVDSSSSTIAYASGALFFQKNSYSLNIENRENLLEKHLSNRFFIDYHFLSAQELINKYGQFFLTSYTSGGRANVIVASEMDSNYSKESSLREVSHYGKLSMTALFKKVDITAEYSTNESTESLKQYKKTLKSLQTGVTTIGGNPIKGVMGFKIISGSDVLQSNFEFKEWLESFNENNEAIAEINSKGLVLIESVIREENIRNSILNTLIGDGAKSTNPMTNPVSFFYVMDNNGFWNLIFSTRFGDYIIFSKSQGLPDIPDWIDFDYSKNDQDYFIKNFSFDSENIIDISEFSNVEFCKIKDSKFPNMTYITMFNRNKKIAFSIFDELMHFYYIKKKKTNQVDNLTGYKIYGL